MADEMTPHDGPLTSREFHAYMERHTERNDKRYAAYWVEQLARGAVTLVLTAVVVALLGLVIVSAR